VKKREVKRIITALKKVLSREAVDYIEMSDVYSLDSNYQNLLRHSVQVFRHMYLQFHLNTDDMLEVYTKHMKELM